MEVKSAIKKASGYVLKYRFAACILLIGIVLMLIPPINPAQIQETEPVSNDTPDFSDEVRLSNILSKIQGAGRVEVMLSHASGAETRYHTDSEHKTDSDRETTVIVTDGERNETALVTRVDPPEYQGAIVLCQGADSAAVRLAIVDAVSKYTGLGADQIAVLKMK